MRIPWYGAFEIQDVSLKVRGQEEDKAFIFIKGIRQNICKGNTFLVDPTRNVTMLRRGAKKIFELSREYITKNIGTFHGKHYGGFRKPEEHDIIRNVIFEKTERFLKNMEGTVTIWTTNKANGENFQISWNKELSCWAIASKYVALCARFRDDVNFYNADRYHFARLMGFAWFDILKKMDHHLLIDLKKDLTDKTLIGEYVGNQSYQHIVKYEKIELIFHAYVYNWGREDYIMPNRAFEIAKKYGLNVVKHTKIQVDSWQKLNEQLLKIYEEVSAKPIETGEEGSVIYLQHNQKDGRSEIASVSKLKTIEYRIYRKLREKLKTYIESTNPNRISYKNVII